MSGARGHQLYHGLRGRVLGGDEDRAGHRPAQPGPLAGAPFAVKNLFDVEGLPTRAGSKINRDRPPSKADATVIARLEAAGAVLMGADAAVEIMLTAVK